MEKKLPVAALVIAILHFVGGGLSLACESSTLVVQFLGGASGVTERFVGANNPSVREMKAMEQHLNKEAAYQEYTFITLTAGMALSVTMIVAGLGLIWRQNWGRYLSFFYALCSIVFRLFTSVYMALFLGAAQASFYTGRTDLPQAVADSQKFNGYFSAAINLVFLVYPIVVLVLLSRPTVVQGFSDDPVPNDDRFRPSPT